MSIFSGLKSVFSGDPKRVMDMAGGIGDFIDESILTPQEKTELNQKLFDAKLKWVGATQGQNLARRYLAMLFGINYIVAYQACLIPLIVDYNKNPSMLSTDFADSVIRLSATFQLGWIMLAIISFYFIKEHAGFRGMISKMSDRK